MTMNHSRLYLYLFLLAACLLAGAADSVSGAPLAPAKILILNSYHYGYRGSDDIVNGFTQSLRKTLPGAETQIEYLDSKNYSGSVYDAKIVDLLRFKYRQRHFDLIFSTDDYAFDVLEKHRDALFGTTPVVFCGTNSFDPSRLAGKHGIIGIDERPSFKDTLDLIFKLHPNTSEVVVIRDDSVTGRLNDAELRKAAAALKGRARFSELAGLHLEDLVRHVRRLQSGSVIVYFASFVQDKTGERISSNDALRAVSAASPVPLYGGWEFNLGSGIVGGRLLNLREHGAAAAVMAAGILKGVPIGSMPLVTPSPNKEMFDYAEMRRFGISESQLPAGSVVLNKPPGFLYQYRVEILAAVSAILLVALAANIGKLINSRKNLKVHRDTLIRRNAELEEALSKVKLLEGIIPVCMYCKKVRKDEESWQQMESYIAQNSAAKFSHGICPSCFHDKFERGALKGERVPAPPKEGDGA